MANFEYEPKNGAVRRIMKSAGMQDLMESTAANMAAQLPNTLNRGRMHALYGSRMRVQKASAHGYVFTMNYAAMLDQAENETLSRLV